MLLKTRQNLGPASPGPVFGPGPGPVELVFPRVLRSGPEYDAIYYITSFFTDSSFKNDNKNLVLSISGLYAVC